MNSMQRPSQTIYLVDGSSYIYRAYHAIRSLSNANGFPTNAVFGFTRMILKLLKEKTPEFLAVVLDAKGRTFRHDLFEDYKANRPPMPDDMAVQIPAIKAVAEALGLCLIEKERYEADDLIGAMARRAEENGFEAVMVTGDKDFRQLVTQRVSMWDPAKDRVIDYDALKETYGLEPEKFIDVMALSGDVSDNIPGVPGIGEKTGVELVLQFGSLEGVLERSSELKKKKLKENLQEFREAALLARKLVAIDRNVPLDVQVDQLKVGPVDSERLAGIFREMGFKELWEQYASRGSTGCDYHLCQSKDLLAELVKRILATGLVSISTATVGEAPLGAELVGLSLAFEENAAYYVPFAHCYLGAPSQLDRTVALEALRPVLEDEKIAKTGHDLKGDAAVLRRYGIDLKGIYFDAMLASYVVNPGVKRHGIDFLAQIHLDHKMPPRRNGKEKGPDCFSSVAVEEAKDYCCEDSDVALRLMGALGKRLKKDQAEDLYYNLEMKLLPVLLDMEWAGIRVDLSLLNRMSLEAAREMRALEQEIHRAAGLEFNINSPKQLGFVLFEKLKLPFHKKTAKNGNYSTDVKTLRKISDLSNPVPGLVLRYRTLSKLKSTYLDGLTRMVNPGTGRIHTSFNQTATATGRLSSSNPNLQNIPVRGEAGREIRKAFVADEGRTLVAADYSQIELRVFAHYSEDDVFLNAFRRDEDVHSRTAAEIFGVGVDAVSSEERRVAKVINFGILYGMGPQKLSEELGVDFKTAKTYIASYLDRYQGVARYREAVVDQAKREGYVSTLFNRRRYLPDISHKNRAIRAEAERMAVNSPIQGTAADLIKKAMVSLHRRLREEKLRARILLQVHDELVVEAPDEEIEEVVPLLKREMEEAHPLKVPLKVDVKVGRSWGEAR